MAESKIEWCDRVWNPIRGCARVSPGCGTGREGGCYAERQAHRFSGKDQPYEGLTVLGKHGPRWTGRARFVPEMLDAPLRWRKSRRIFVNSMSDLFHADITNEQIAAVFGVMAACPQHVFQVLTKRPDRMLAWFRWVEILPTGDRAWTRFKIAAHGCTELKLRGADRLKITPDDPWPLPNVHLGVSCEDQPRADERIQLLLQCHAAVRFVSAEPLLGPINLCAVPDNKTRPAMYHASCSPLGDLDWVIVGGESGPGARPCDIEWIRSIVQQCKEADVPVFCKQLGAHPIQDGVRLIKHDRKGGDMHEMPHDIRVREFPKGVVAGE